MERTVEESESGHIYSLHQLLDPGSQGVANSVHGGLGKVLGLSHVVPSKDQRRDRAWQCTSSILRG